MALAFEPEPTFTRGALTQLFECNFVGGGLLLAEGTSNAEGEATQPQVIVVQNWFEELRRLVPTD